MRRFSRWTALAALVAATLVGSLATAEARPKPKAPDVSTLSDPAALVDPILRPACADLDFAEGTMAPGALSLLVALTDTSCTAVEYTLVVRDDADSRGRPLATASVNGDGENPFVFLFADIDPEDGDACLFVESSYEPLPGVSLVGDRMPASGCALASNADCPEPEPGEEPIECGPFSFH